MALALDDAGINPLPTELRIPIWFGGHHDLTLRRVAKWGDGWMMNDTRRERPRRNSSNCAPTTNRKAGSRPHWRRASTVSTGAGDEASWREEYRILEERGRHSRTVNGALSGTVVAGYRLTLIAGPLTALERYRDAIADLL